VGNLYDKRDLEHDLGEIDKLEQTVSRNIVDGTFDAMHAAQADSLFEAERRRCKIRKLRSDQLISDLRVALALYRACPHCHDAPNGRQRPCGAHKAIVNGAKKAIHWATQDNLGRRAAAGTSRPDEDGDASSGECNQWETWYYADRRAGIWPGETSAAIEYNKEHYDTLDYRGWLRMLLHEEEISLDEYQGEMARLRGEA
jgi:hypothetical protein